MIRDAADFPNGVQLYGLTVLSLTVLSLIKVPLLTLAGLVVVLACLLLVLPATRRRAGLGSVSV